MGVLDLIQNYPEPLKRLFILSTFKPTLAVSGMLDLFCVDLSENGTNVREKKELIVVYWNDFLHDVHNGRAGNVFYSIILIIILLSYPF